MATTLRDVGVCAGPAGEHEIACPSCGRLIVEHAAPIAPPVRGDGSVWGADRPGSPRMPMGALLDQLLLAQQRVTFNPKDAEALQALWCWQEVIRLRRFRSMMKSA